VNTNEFKRKLTAIFSADVAGYGRLMGEDEDGTVRTLKVYRELIAGHIQEGRGRVVDSPGDNILAEFASVVDAVKCAVKIQTALNDRNEELPRDKRMQFRIGVNLGDVIEDENRIYGDGVNIAARLESLAEAGSICISGSAHEQIKNKLPFGYEQLGEHSVKNITEPLKVYRVLLEPGSVGKVIGERKARRNGRKWALMAVIVMVIAAAGFSVWNFYFRSTFSPKKTASLTAIAVSLTDRASIAVLPFNNLSNDPDQEYFSDGVTNDIITDLSKFNELLVIASNTVFTYKGRPVKVLEVSRELGVRYVLEGSVQKARDKIRINAQLIDATTGHHLWAERYEKNLKDLFSVQEEIVQTIVATLAIKINAAERTRAMRKDTDNLEAYDYLLRGREYYNQRTRKANINARKMFQKSIELDPAYATAYAALAESYVQMMNYGWTEFPAQTGQKAVDLVKKALRLDESSAAAHALLGAAHVYQEEYDLAFSELQQAIALNPNDASSYRVLGWGLLFSGRVDEAIDVLQTALQIDPNSSPSAFFLLGVGFYLKEQYDKAIGTLRKGISRKSDFVDFHIALAAAYARAGRQGDAVKEANTVLKLNPFFEVNAYGTAFRNPADRDKIRDGLRRAGLK
jgi:adenylate cyclase